LTNYKLNYAQGQCRRWKLYRRVARRALPIHFFRQFLL